MVGQTHEDINKVISRYTQSEESAQILKLVLIFLESFFNN